MRMLLNMQESGCQQREQSLQKKEWSKEPQDILKNWINSPIRQVMEQEFHIPTEVLNDANAAALGEAWIGAAKGKKDVVVVTIGTGVGGGISHEWKDFARSKWICG